MVGGVVDKLGPELAEGAGYFNHAFHFVAGEPVY